MQLSLNASRVHTIIFNSANNSPYFNMSNMENAYLLATSLFDFLPDTIALVFTFPRSIRYGGANASEINIELINISGRSLGP